MQKQKSAQRHAHSDANGQIFEDRQQESRQQNEGVTLGSADVLMNTGAMLEDLGHSVIEATSGQRALELLASDGTIDLMITDEAMPRMRGSELIEQAQKLRSTLPIILATGYAEVPRIGDGVVPKLNKPFTQDELARAIWGAIQCKPKDVATIDISGKFAASAPGLKLEG